MGTISYNSDEMAAVHTAYKASLEAVTPIKTAMLNDVKKIRGGWSGDDAILAEPDLKAIEDQITNIETNLTEILNLTEKVMGDFSQIKYKESEEGKTNG